MKKLTVKEQKNIKGGTVVNLECMASVAVGNLEAVASYRAVPTLTRG